MKKFCKNCGKEKGLWRRHRNNEVKIRLTVEEKKKINERAESLGLKISQYARVMALYGIKIPNQVLL